MCGTVSSEYIAHAYMRRLTRGRYICSTNNTGDRRNWFNSFCVIGWINRCSESTYQSFCFLGLWVCGFVGLWARNSVSFTGVTASSDILGETEQTILKILGRDRTNDFEDQNYCLSSHLVMPLLIFNWRLENPFVLQVSSHLVLTASPVTSWARKIKRRLKIRPIASESSHLVRNTTTLQYGRMYRWCGSIFGKDGSFSHFQLDTRKSVCFTGVFSFSHSLASDILGEEERTFEHTWMIEDQKHWPSSHLVLPLLIFNWRH